MLDFFTLISRVFKSHLVAFKTVICKAILMVLLAVVSNVAWAGDLEDGIAAYQNKDYAIALKLFRSVAATKNASAQFNLGRMYYFGEGVSQDFRKAVEWFRMAAKQGDAKAQYLLGMLYYSGDGAHQDYIRAYMWNSLAVASGYKDAGMYRDAVAAEMTQQQISEAQKMAKECLANNYKGCN